MKKQRTATEVSATAAGHRRGRTAALIGLAVGLLAAFVAPDFHAANCVLLIAVAVMGGIMAGRTAAMHHPGSAAALGRSGGTRAAFGFTLPFIAIFAWQALRMDADQVARLMAALSPPEIEAIKQAGLTIGASYFQGQLISYIGAYILFGALWGQLGGWIGGLIGRKSLDSKR
ncbi:MAG: hypothetical protein K1X39_11505 [Thermoflexales bacterium]|nr:hypothetical protein [Thermoflexales bacterium]